jgi:hypothetical protein
MVTNLPQRMRHGGCLPLAKTPALLLVVGGLHLVIVRLLAASRGTWCCLAIASAVWDIIEGRRLRQRQLVATWPAADRGGLLRHG